jgi:hypothetical protein
MVRTTEMRAARWEEFENWEGRAPLWRIPAARMKARAEHLVPLSRWASLRSKSSALCREQSPRASFEGMQRATAAAKSSVSSIKPVSLADYKARAKRGDDSDSKRTNFEREVDQIRKRTEAMKAELLVIDQSAYAQEKARRPPSCGLRCRSPCPRKTGRPRPRNWPASIGLPSPILRSA